MTLDSMTSSIPIHVHSPSHSGAVLSYSAQGLLRILGYACIVGFLADMLILAAPPNFGDLQWRVGIVRSLGDRSVVLLLGTVFAMLGNLDTKVVRKPLSLACLGVGTLFMVLTIVAIQDGVVLQKFAANNIVGQADQAQEQIEKLKSDPKASGKLTSEQLQQLTGRLTQQSKTLQQNATTQITKTGASSAANLIIIGTAMIGVGRYGLRR